MEGVDDRPVFRLAHLQRLPDGRQVEWEAIGEGPGEDFAALREPGAAVDYLRDVFLAALACLPTSGVLTLHSSPTDSAHIS